MRATTSNVSVKFEVDISIYVARSMSTRHIATGDEAFETFHPSVVDIESSTLRTRNDLKSKKKKNIIKHLKRLSKLLRCI